MFSLANRVKDTAATITGTGSYTLAGSPPTGFQSFASAFGSGSTRVIYEANDGAGKWEINVGTFNGTTGLTRDLLINSSTGSAISWSAATPSIFVTAPAKIMQAQPSAGLNRSRWYGGESSNSMRVGVSATAGTLTAVPIYIPDYCKITGIGVACTASATGTVNLGIYAGQDGIPTSLLYDSGALTVATGANQATPNLIVPPSYIWAAALFTGSPTVLGSNSTDDYFRAVFSGGASVSDNATVRPCAFASGQTSPLSNPFPSPQFGNSAVAVNVLIQVADF